MIPAAYLDITTAGAQAHAVPLALLDALIQHESGWNPDAVGDGGAALGLGQMHAGACSDVGANWNEMNNPLIAIPAVAAYLAKMLALFNGNEEWALAAYNQGPTVIGRGRSYAAAVLKLVDPSDA